MRNWGTGFLVSCETSEHRHSMFSPNRFLIARFGLYICLNLSMCAKMKEQF